MRAILHVDMDAFYAAVEVRDRPQLRGLPVVVGGSPQGRGVVAAASYAARRYGIHSAMPARTALRLCPEVVFIPPRHRHYSTVSAQLREILERYTPVIEPLALDEAFLDVSGSLKLWDSADSIARRIKQDISSELRLTASVGVAPNKFLAKLAADLDKPDGLVVVPAGGVQAFLDPLPVERIWGVGKRTRGTLRRLGIESVGDLRRQSGDELQRLFGAFGRRMWELAQGHDDRAVVSDREARSLSHETTFATDVRHPEVLHEVLRELTEQVAARLRAQHLQARTVRLKVRYGDFATLTRSRTREVSTNLTRELLRTGQALLQQVLAVERGPVRLLGFGLTGLEPHATGQQELFPDRQQLRQARVDAVTDRINKRFGTRVLHRGLNRS